MDAHLSLSFLMLKEKKYSAKNTRARGNGTRRRPRETRNASFAPELRALNTPSLSLCFEKVFILYHVVVSRREEEEDEQRRRSYA
jgi:hypothetical protein